MIGINRNAGCIFSIITLSPLSPPSLSLLLFLPPSLSSETVLKALSHPLNLSVQLERMLLSPRDFLAFQARSVESVSDGQASPLLKPHVGSNKNTVQPGRLTANAFQRCSRARLCRTAESIQTLGRTLGIKSLERMECWKPASLVLLPPFSRITHIAPIAPQEKPVPKLCGRSSLPDGRVPRNPLRTRA